MLRVGVRCCVGIRWSSGCCGLRERLKILGCEVSAVVCQGILMFFGCGRFCFVFDVLWVVVFVHGYGAGGAVFDPLRCVVEGELGLLTLDFTYCSSWSFSCVLDVFDVELVCVGDAEFDLVGHFFGGFVARWWVQEMGGVECMCWVVILVILYVGICSARVALGSLCAVLMP